MKIGASSAGVRRVATRPIRLRAAARASPRRTRDRARVARQPVEIRAVNAGKGLEPVERPCLLEGLRVELDRRVRRIDAGMPAQRLLVRAGMRSAVGAEEEFRIATRRCAHQRLAVLLALQHRQTVIVRPDAAREHCAAVVKQVVRGDRGGDVRTPRQHELHRLAGGCVLDHDAKPREAARDLCQDCVEKHALAIENVHARSRDLSMNEQGQLVLFHGRERRMGALDAGDTGLRIRRCTRGVVLHAAYEAGFFCARDLLRTGVIGQIEGHQGLETGALRQSVKDPAAVGGSERGARDRRPEIRHDHRPREHARGVGKHAREGGAVSKVQVSVVRAGKGQGLHEITGAGVSSHARAPGRARTRCSSSLR